MRPAACSAAAPAIATAMASAHIRIRRQSPKFATSAIAPIVQKLTRWPTAPKTIAEQEGAAGDDGRQGIRSGHPEIMARDPKPIRIGRADDPVTPRSPV